jgi:hypothetical protein
MQIATTPVQSMSTTQQPVVATVSYVIRAPQGGERQATIEAMAQLDKAVTISGPFQDAFAAARKLASVPVSDGIHHHPVFQSHAVLQAADGAYLVAPLVGDHRSAIGPVFIDGDLYDRVGLAVWGRRAPDAPHLRAIVGGNTWIDLTRRPVAGVSLG